MFSQKGSPPLPLSFLCSLARGLLAPAPALSFLPLCSRARNSHRVFLKVLPPSFPPFFRSPLRGNLFYDAIISASSAVLDSAIGIGSAVPLSPARGRFRRSNRLSMSAKRRPIISCMCWRVIARARHYANIMNSLFPPFFFPPLSRFCPFNKFDLWPHFIYRLLVYIRPYAAVGGHGWREGGCKRDRCRPFRDE